MSKFRTLGCLVLLVLLGVGYLGAPLATVHATSITVSYATNDGTTLSQAVNALTANRTDDMPLSGSPSPTWGSGLTFTPNGYLQTGAAGWQNAVTALSLEAWVTVANLTSSRPVISTYNGGAGGGYYVSVLNSGQLRFVLVSGAAVKTQDSVATVNAGVKTFLGISFNGTYVTMQVGATQETYAMSYQITSSNYDFRIGQQAYNAQYMNGTLFSLAFYPNYSVGATVLSTVYAAGSSALLSVSGLGVLWKFDEGSGTTVYGYDDNTALTTTPTARLISQTAGGVNSSIIDTNPFPVSNATDKYAATAGFFDRVNTSTPQVLTLTHSVYDTFGVSPSGTGAVNVTNGWVIAGSPFSVLATPYIGQYFQYWQRDGVTEGTGNPGIVAATGTHAYVAVFGPTPYVIPPYPLVISSFPLTWMLFGVWLALMFLFQRHELKFLAGIFGVMLGWQTFAGEYWLTLTSLGVTATIRYSTIFSIPMALFEVAFSTIVMFNVMWALMHRQEPTEKRPR